jgi:hypothetical protein
MEKPNRTRTISGSWLWFLVIGFWWLVLGEGGSVAGVFYQQLTTNNPHCAQSIWGFHQPGGTDADAQAIGLGSR